MFRNVVLKRTILKSKKCQFVLLGFRHLRFVSLIAYNFTSIQAGLLAQQRPVSLEAKTVPSRLGTTTHV